MTQDPKLTVGLAMSRLEACLLDLGDGPAERRARGQFHQLVLALERERRILWPPSVAQPGAPAHTASGTSSPGPNPRRHDFL